MLKDRSHERSFLTPSTENRLFYLLHNLGIMAGGQVQKYRVLNHVPKTSRKIMRRLKEEHKIIEHAYVQNSKGYAIYTLGPAGAASINVPYAPNYWFNYSDREAIQRLMAVDLYIRMCDYLSSEIQVKAAEKPYLYTFAHQDKLYNIGVIWENETSFLEAYRWEAPQERTILISPSLGQVTDLLSCLSDYLPIRVITREKLRQDLVFYRPENGKWVLDIPEKEVQLHKKLRIVHKHRVLLP